MNAIVYPSSSSAPDRFALQERLARVSGVLYLILALLGMFAPIVLESLVVSGDAAATAGNVVDSLWLFRGNLVAWFAIVVVDVGLAITLYLLLEPVSRALSLIAAAFRLVYAAILGALLLNLYDAFLLLTSAERGAGFEERQRQIMALSAIDTFNAGFLLALVFFGVHLVTLGFLLSRSLSMPRVLGILLAFGGFGYILHGLANVLVDGGGLLASAVILAPATAGELGLAVWLLVKGVKMRRSATMRNPIVARPTPADAPIVGARGGAR